MEDSHMADIKSKSGMGDGTHINVNEDHELRYLDREDRLHDYGGSGLPVAAVGVMADRVEAYLKKDRR
jgi:hypothetical protein